MPISRRNLLSKLMAGAATGAALQTFRDFSFAQTPSVPRIHSFAQPILLSHNENPYGPSEKVLSVMREALSGSNRYPRTEYDSLLNKIASLHRVKPEQIVLGCGSSEILRLAAAANGTSLAGNSFGVQASWQPNPRRSGFQPRRLCGV